MTVETAEIIEADVVEVDQPRALVVQQPGQALVAQSADPSAMVAVATRLATVLKDIVEQRTLYATIQGKKYPTVEAWMTIARLDNVVAREARPPIRHEDGSYEAYAELIRLSDGMVIGGASALCGSPDDAPWGGTPAKYGKPAQGPRPEHARRSMAATRATSRAFRAHYSWIMALAGYEPTPADEMPHDQRDVTPRGPDRGTPAAASAAKREVLDAYMGGDELTGEQVKPVLDALDRRANPQHGPDGLIGMVEVGKPPVDMETRQTPDGPAWGFKLAQGRKGFQALAHGPLAQVLAMAGLEVGTRVTVWGRIEEVPWEKAGKPMPPYLRVHIERVQTPEWTLPGDVPDEPNGPALGPLGPENEAGPEGPVEAESVPVWEPLDDDEKAAITGNLPG